MLTLCTDLNMPMNGVSTKTDRHGHKTGPRSERGDDADSLISKESIQKTIMAMTLGKDVSALFPDVLKNIATADLEQKKLVYLYLM